MTIISRSNDHLTVERHVVHYAYKGADRTEWADTAEAAQARQDWYDRAGADWTPRHTTVERVTYKVGDEVEVQAFGRTRWGRVSGIGRTKLQLTIVRNAQGDLHSGSYAALYVHNLTTAAVDVTPAPTVTVTPEAQAELDRIAGELEAARAVKLTDRDSTDQADLYLDGQLVLPALTRAERDDLFQQLAKLDAAQDHGYDVQELRGLDLPHAMALVHHARVHHLALYHDGELLDTFTVDARLTTDQVRERAVALAAEVSRRVREGEL